MTAKTYTDAYFDWPPEGLAKIAENVAVSWTCGEEHSHSIECLWVWHDCAKILGPDSVAPGKRYGWCPSGVSLHTLVQQEPLTVTASIYWPVCCGLHGFITNGKWEGV
jgi:hypothetical protein